MRKQYGVLVEGTGAPKPKDLKYSPYLVPVRLVDIPREEYFRRVEVACTFLEGNNREAVDQIQEQMRSAAQERQFEKAAELRDVLNSLRDIARSARERKFARDLTPRIDRQAEMAELQRALNLPTLPAHIEGFDISNISGTLSVASMVCARNGKPNKDHYRRFRIRTVTGSDDFASMAEVVSRRYGHHPEDLPDLVMVDGGAGQLAGGESFAQQGVSGGDPEDGDEVDEAAGHSGGTRGSPLR